MLQVPDDPKQSPRPWGTWNVTPFGNDAAMDWLSDLMSDNGGPVLLELHQG